MLYQYKPIGQYSCLVDAFFEMNIPGRKGGAKDLILPDCTPGLMYIEKGGFCRKDKRKTSCLSEGKFYLFGQKTNAVEYRFDERPTLAFGLKFKPATIYQYFGISAHEITDQVIELKDLTKADEVEELIDNTQGDRGKTASLYAFLGAPGAASQPDSMVLLEQLLGDIHNAQGSVTIHGLSEKYNIGYKRIERLFKQYVGLTPKLYTRIIRFNACVKYAFESQPDKLTDIAYQSDFFDQTHFIKETRRFTGLSPSEVFAKNDTPLEKEQLDYLIGRNY